MSDRVFVGRVRELERISASIAAVRSGRGALVLFAGEAGIGKTQLAARAAALAEREGFRVVWGRCWESGGAPAYFPWSQVFAELGLTSPFASIDTGAADGREVRFRQFDEAARLLVSEAPLAIVLDDLHAADVPSLQFLQALARRLAGTRLLLLGTYRDIEARLGGAGAVLPKIGREGDVLSLDRLSRAEILDWIRETAPGTSDDAAAQICEVTEGNPLFVHEVLRLRKRPDVRRLPDGLHAVIEEHIARVPLETRALLATAAVWGREIAVADVAALAGIDTDQVAEQLGDACDRGLLEPIAGERFSFSHVLVRDRLYAQLAASQRASLHVRAGERLVATDLSRAAHHFHEGRAAADPARVAAVTRDAARAALLRFAFEDAERLSALALEHGAEGTVACELELVRGEALIRMGDGERGKALAVHVASKAQSLGAPAIAAQAALVYGAELTSAMTDATMVRLLREALVGAVDDALRARVMARLATALTPPTTVEVYAECGRLAREAMAIAQRLGDARTLLYVGHQAMSSRYYHMTRAERDATIDLVVAQATALDDQIVLLHAGPFQFANLRERGAQGAADAALARYAARVGELASPQYHWRVPMMQATRAMLAGDFAAAEGHGEEGLALAERHQLVAGQIGWAVHRIALAMARGEPASIAPVAERILAILQRTGSLRTTLVPWIHAALDQAAEARAILTAVPFNSALYVPSLVAADAAVLLGDQALASRLLPVLEPMCDDRLVYWGAPPCGTVIGPIARIVAELLALLGRTDEARRRYDQAIAIAETLGAAPFVTLARRGRDALGTHAAPTHSAPTVTHAALTRIGEHWSVCYGGRTSVLKARRGVAYLARLLEEPGRELHVLELSASAVPRGGRRDAVLDGKAKAGYRARIDRLREAAERAEEMGDADAADRARGEIDAIAGELARALGLGGRDRVMTTEADRARAAVTLAIRRAIEAIAEVEPVLGGHLDAAIRTGVFCCYRPDPRAALGWQIVE